MLRFQICHLFKNSENKELRPEGPGPLFLFETCLRKIWIAPEGALTGPGLLTGFDAYQFLLEVITGLHSPIFGETEILGQFRQFLETNKKDPSFGFFQTWSQQLLEDTKFLRTSYMQGQGQHSYGSLLRKRLKTGEKIWIVGAGQLTEAMLPWLSEQSVTLWVRDPQKAQKQFPNVTVKSLAEAPADDVTLLIAAPLSETELQSVLEKARGPWVDLREKNVSPSLRPAEITLADLYRETTLDREQKSELRLTVLGQIQELSVTRWNRAWFRPQGWEDVCAS